MCHFLKFMSNRCTNSNKKRHMATHGNPKSHVRNTSCPKWLAAAACRSCCKNASAIALASGSSFKTEDCKVITKRLVNTARPAPALLWGSTPEEIASGRWKGVQRRASASEPPSLDDILRTTLMCPVRTPSTDMAPDKTGRPTTLEVNSILAHLTTLTDWC